MPRKARKKPHKPLPFGGDHGTGTALANRNTVLEPCLNDEGKNPNNMGRRRRREAFQAFAMSQRQVQAAEAIRNAYCKNEALSSGSPLKERVDASPKPDATIDVQVSARSRLVFVMSGVPSAMRPVVEWVCWKNRPVTEMPGPVEMHRANFKVAMDLVANRLGY